MPYSPQQNGVAERRNRSLQEMALSMLADADMPKLYWGEAVLTAAYLLNRLPSRVVSKTPYELWTGEKPDFAALRVFGCDAYVQVPEQKRSKLDFKAVKLTFVGYAEDRKGYRFVDRSTNKVTLSRDAKFIELGNGSDQAKKPIEPEPSEILPEFEVEIPFTGGDKQMIPDEARSEFDDDGRVSSSDSEGWADATSGGSGAEDPRIQEEPRVERRTRRNRGVLPVRYNDYVVGIAREEAEEPTDWLAEKRVIGSRKVPEPTHGGRDVSGPATTQETYRAWVAIVDRGGGISTANKTERSEVNRADDSGRTQSLGATVGDHRAFGARGSGAR